MLLADEMREQLRRVHGREHRACRRVLLPVRRTHRHRAPVAYDDLAHRRLAHQLTALVTEPRRQRLRQHPGTADGHREPHGLREHREQPPEDGTAGRLGPEIGVQRVAG